LDVVSLFGRKGGVALPDRHPSRLDYRAQDLTRRAAMLNMPFHLKPAHVPTNPAPASYAIIAAQNAGNGDLGGLVQGILRAAWAEEKDIASDAVLQDLLDANGFDRSLTMSGMLSGAETYAQNLEDAVSHGVFGAPFCVLEDGAKFWGQDRLGDLEAYLTKGS
jgi:2-hydroxychromene-2-carboxylate isomerase